MHFFFLKKFTVFENVDESLNSITFTAESNWKGEGGGGGYQPKVSIPTLNLYLQKRRGLNSTPFL